MMISRIISAVTGQPVAAGISFTLILMAIASLYLIISACVEEETHNEQSQR